jgi:carboxypeptidase C (cathepsin A)
MKHRRLSRLSVGFLIVFGVSAVWVIGQETRRPGQAAAGVPEGGPVAQQPATPPLPPDKPFAVTRHTVTVDGKPLAYTATAGLLTVNKADERPGARIYFTAYTLDGVRDVAARPLTFVFNGGPGSSSVWLHLGGLGPRRVLMTDEGFAVKPPYGLADSEHTLLDATDMVFIDPVSTGYSRPLPGENKAQFHGVAEDLASVGEFIRLYVTRFERWSSPKFLLGESYGTTRAAGLSGFLQGRATGMFLNGIILVSSVLDFQTITFTPGNVISYIVFLPHYTATAWYHKKLPPALQARPLKDVLAEAEAFALNDYSVALLKGNRLTPEETARIADRLAALTGLDRGYILSANLRIRHDRFVKELRRADMETVGRLDSRFKGRDADAAGETYEFDPASAAIQGAFSTMINHYLRKDLQVKEDLPYAIYGSVFPWNFFSSPDEASGPGPGSAVSRGRAGFGGAVLNVAETLRRAMSENPSLRVFVANGYYDGATPYYGTAYTFAQLGLNGEFAGRVRMGYYEAGHMMYIHKPSLAKLKADLAEFIKR